MDLKKDVILKSTFTFLFLFKGGNMGYRTRQLVQLGPRSRKGGRNHPRIMDLEKKKSNEYIKKIKNKNYP